MDVVAQAAWPNGTNYGTMTPQSLNSQAGDWSDILFTGLAGAAVNAAYNLSDTVGNPPPPGVGISIGTSGNIMPLIVVGVILYALFAKG